MVTIKSFSDLEQSKKLAEILPLESADMYLWSSGKRYYIEAMDDGDFNEEEGHVRAWSLTALLDVLNRSAYFVNEAGIAELSSIKATKWCVSILNCGKIENCYADNPVDACVAMIEKLNELNLL